jgi:cobalt/nickel transport protein
MRFLLQLTISLTWLGVGIPASQAHYNMLLPQTASAKKGEAVPITYQWGHPFEHQLFDAPAPESVMLIAPDGKKSDLTKSLERIVQETGDGRKAAAYRFQVTPDQRGDYMLLLTTPPIWMEEDQEFLQDTVKVILHVQAQKGWDKAAGHPLELLPLTRPYGLQPVMAFQAQIIAAGPDGNKPSSGTLVEIEHYNPEPPKDLPPDEQITRTAKTDPNGVVTCTLTDPGWWCLTAQRDGPKKAHEGKEYPVRQRSTLWVFVDEKVSVRPTR